MIVSGGLVAAQSAPDGENGRYSMTPIPEGVLRLDTRTGTVSTCNKNGAGWACYAVPDERTALDAEIGRLQAEVERLKGQLAAGPTVSGKTDEALPKSDPLKKAEPKVAEGERKIEIPLPGESARVDVLKIHAAPITKKGDIDYESVVKLADGFNAADLRNVCTEAGMFAIRGERDYAVEEDFMKAVRKVGENKKLEGKLEYSKV